MADKAEKIREKQGSIELDIDFEKTAGLSFGFLMVLGVAYFTGIYGVASLMIIGLLIYFLDSSGSYDEGSIFTRIFNLFIVVFMLPVYPFKKMLDYSNADLEPEKDAEKDI